MTGSWHLTCIQDCQIATTESRTRRSQAWATHERTGTFQDPWRSPGMGELHPCEMVFKHYTPSVRVHYHCVHTVDFIVGCMAIVQACWPHTALFATRTRYYRDLLAGVTRLVPLVGRRFRRVYSLVVALLEADSRADFTALRGSIRAVQTATQRGWCYNNDNISIIVMHTNVGGRF